MQNTAKLIKLFPLLLAGSLFIGIISNLIYPKNVKASCLVVILCCLIWLARPYFNRYTNRLSHKTVNWLLAGGLILILGGQLLILQYLPATIYHDPFRVLHQAELLSQGQHHWQSSTYFWRYPNNVPLTFLLAQWLKFTTILRLSTNTALHLLSLGLLDGFILGTLLQLRRLSQRNSSVLALLLFFLVTPFAYTYYLQVFYSDLPILVCLLLIFNILQRWPQLTRNRKISAGSSLFLLTLFGQLIKPNLIVLAMAVIIFLGALLLWQRASLGHYLLPLVVILLGFGATIPAKMVIVQSSDFTTNATYAMPTTHWIWMSYNPKSHGAYVGTDVKHMTQLPNKTVRQHYIAHALPQRLKKLGVRGVVARWLIKVGILLNVSNIQKAYTGGYQEAPAWFLNDHAVLSLTSTLSMRVGFIIIYSLALLKCLTILANRKLTLIPSRDLAILTAVGYLAFHALLWEAESRYGQPLLPLLLFMTAYPLPAVPNQRRRHRNWLPCVAILLASMFFFTEITPLFPLKTLITAGQRSQLSLQYKVTPQKIKPGTVLRQSLNLNHVTTKLSVALPQQTHIQAYLTAPHQQTYSLRQTGSTLKLATHLAPGHYQLVLRNYTTKPQQVEIVHTQKFRLARHPLLINGRQKSYNSLIYKASYNPRSQYSAAHN